PHFYPDIRTLRLTWRRLETWPWWNCAPTPHSKAWDWKPSTYRRRACPRPYLKQREVERSASRLEHIERLKYTLSLLARLCRHRAAGPCRSHLTAPATALQHDCRSRSSGWGHSSSHTVARRR